jgi:RNA polymerase sigma factor (sigma-70 family)
METTSAETEKAQNFDCNQLDLRRREMEAIVSRHFPVFHRQAIRYLGNAADAEDAVQDAMLSAFRHLGQFRGQAQMSTWLTRIVINSARMQLRRRSCENQISIDEQPQERDALPILEQLADRGLSPEEACRRANLAYHASELAKELSPNLREAFQLRDLEGRTIREMTDKLGANAGTVKTRVSRARAKLRRLARTI